MARGRSGAKISALETLGVRNRFSGVQGPGGNARASRVWKGETPKRPKPLAASLPKSNHGFGHFCFRAPEIRIRAPGSQHRKLMALIDKFGRPITDLRVSVTDRCNFRCVYCRS